MARGLVALEAQQPLQLSLPLLSPIWDTKLAEQVGQPRLLLPPRLVVLVALLPSLVAGAAGH
jgi:hypothetical protein